MVWKLLKRKYAVNVWDISSWLCRWLTSGAPRSLPNKIGYLLGLADEETGFGFSATERHAVIQPGALVNKLIRTAPGENKSKRWKSLISGESIETYIDEQIVFEQLRPK